MTKTKDKTELKEKELNNVTGGIGLRQAVYVCPNCGKEKGYSVGIHYCPDCGEKMKPKTK